MHKDNWKRLFMWPLSDSSMNRVLRVAKIDPVGEPLEVKKSYQQLPVGIFKPKEPETNETRDCKNPDFLMRMMGKFEYPDSERPSDVHSFMVREAKPRIGIPTINSGKP